MNRKGFVPAGSPGEKQCRRFNYVSWVGAFCALLSLQFLSSAGVFLTDGFLFEPSELHAAQVKSVQRGSVTFTSGANRMAVTLSPAVDPTKTIVWGGISHGGGRSSGANANDTRIGFDLESSPTLALERLGSPTSTPVVEWQAVEFESGVSVQRGLRTLTTSQSTVNVTLPTAVDLTKSFVLVSVAPNSSSQTTDERWTIRSRLTTSNNLELSRNESGTAVDIYWQVIQMEGAAVQRGLLTLASGVSTDFAVIPSVNTANSYLIMSYRGAAAVNGIESQYLTRGVILDGDENIDIILFNRESFTNSVDIAWEVVSMSDGTVVQSNILGTNGPNDTILDQSISAVDLTRTFVYLSVQGGSGTQTANLDEGSWTVTLTSSTNLRFQRSSSGTSGTINWQVIQFAGIPPTKLAITSVNSGLSPQAGVGFPVVVQAQDSSGIARNVTSATNVSLSLKTGTGTLGGTLTGAIPAGSSQVTINGVTYTKAESGVSLTATRTSGDSLSPGDSAPFTVNPGAATTLAFSTQPANATAGSAIGGPPTITVRDNFGNTVTSSTASITIAIGANPGGGTLSGTTTKNASAGVATFTDLSINRPGTGYTLTASSTGLSGATSSGFDISVGAASVLAFSVQPGSISAGSTIPGPPTVVVQDGVGNTVTTSTASITVAIGTNPGGGVLSGTTTKNASGGIASFTDLSINQSGYGYTLTASSTGLTGATSSSFNIVSPAPDLVITDVSNPPASAVAGTSFNVTDTTANAGSFTAGASTTSYRLSLDSAITPGDPLLSGTRSVPSLTAGTNSTGSTSVTIPVSLAAGTYFLGACADHANVVAESSETNNCRASTTTVSVSAAPRITALSPTAGPVGTSVTISGSEFGSTQGTSTVTFNGTAASPTSWSATSIAAPVPAGATTGLIIVSVGGVASNGVLFTVGPTGTISGNISKAAGGTPIGGALIEALQSAVVKGSATSGADGNYSMAGVPVGLYDVRASAGNFATQTQSGITVNSGATTTVNFSLNVVSSTSGITYVYDELNRLKAVLNLSGEAAKYSFDSVGNLLSISRYDSSQVSIIEFTPNTGLSDTTVTIYGTGFSTTPSQNSVTFNGTPATVNSSTLTQIVTAVPAGATTGPITVTTPTGSASSAEVFTISSQAPTISTMIPDIGQAGTPVTINGTNFISVPGQNFVRFYNNPTRAYVAAATSTTISTLVPGGALTGRISVATPYGSGSSPTYFFVPPSPYVASDVEPYGPIGFGESKLVTINNAGKVGLLAFDGTAGQKMSLQLSDSTFPNPGFFAWAVRITIYKPDGSQFVQADMLSPTGFLDVQTLPLTGTYTILIDPWESNTGQATIRLNNVPPDDQGTIVPGGSPVTVVTTVPGQNASLTFNGTQDQVISLVMSNSTYPNPGGFAWAVTLTIYKPDGSLLVQTGMLSPGGFLDRQTLPVTGTYKILIDPWESNTGQATINLYDVPADNQGSIVPGGAPVNISTTVPGQNVRLTFAGLANQRVNLQVTNSTFPNPGGFSNAGTYYILKPDGQTVLAQTPIYGATASLGPLILPEDGTYTIFFDATGTGTGQATLQLFSAPAYTLSFNGKIRDRVGQGDSAVNPDGSMDGTFTVTLQAGSGDRTVTSLDLRRVNDSGIWDTVPNGYWVLGAASSLDAALYNSPTGTVNFLVSDGGSFTIFASDWNDSLFTQGTLFTLYASFSDGSIGTASVTLP